MIDLFFPNQTICIMKKDYILLLMSMLGAPALMIQAQTYSLYDLTTGQFAEGGNEQWCFERHDLNAGTFEKFTTYGDHSTAVNYYDQYLTERFCLYPIMNRPASGTQYEVKRNAWFTAPGEYVYIAEEYPDGTSIGTNLRYGDNYPDSLSGYEVYALHTGVSAAITFTVPEDGYYKADMRIIRQDLWNSIGPMKVYQYFRFNDDTDKSYPMTGDFSYGIGEGIDPWASGKESLYNKYFAMIPESPTVNGNSGKPFRGLPSNSVTEYFFFYAKTGDKLSFDTDARSTGNTENTPRGAYARSKWTNLSVTKVTEQEAIVDSKYINPYFSDPELEAALETLLEEINKIFISSNNYSQAALTELGNYASVVEDRFYDNNIMAMEIPSIIEELQRLLTVCRASEGGLKLHYNFDNVDGLTVTDASGQNNDGTLKNNASIVRIGDYNVLDLGSSNGYLDMGENIGNVVSGMTDYTVSAYYRVDEDAPFSGNGFMLFAFSSVAANSASAGEYIFYRLPDNEYGVSSAGWSNGTSVKGGQDGLKGEWQHLIVQQKGNTCIIYLNGEELISQEFPTATSKISKATPYNWIGRPPFSGDNYLKNTLVYDFRLYNYAIADEEIAELATEVEKLEKATNFSDNGDYTELNKLISEYSSFVGNITLGEAAGSYNEADVEDFRNILEISRMMAAENTSSQIKINAQTLALKEAFETLTGKVNFDKNGLDNGLYHIRIADTYYLTNKGSEDMPNGSAFKVSNGGLNEDRINEDMSQVFKVAKVTSLSEPRYSVFSEFDEDGTFRHITEKTELQSSWGNPGGGTSGSDDDWRTFNIYFNGTKYAIQNAGRSSSSGYWYYDEANQSLVKGGSYPSYVFDFIPYDLSGIKDVNISDVRIMTAENGINVITDSAVELTVYTVSGSVISRQNIASSVFIPVEKGIYIVKADGLAVKILVK